MNFWLLKTEPNCWSWAQQTEEKTATWEGVRNPQAQKYMRTMVPGDRAFFYHTGTERRIMGLVTIVTLPYPDLSDPKEKAVMVDVTAQEALQTPVSLQKIKKHPELQHLLLLKQGRLSVVPIDPDAWTRILTLAATPTVQATTP